MKTIKDFNFRRIALLIRNDVKRVYGASAIGAGALFSILFLLLYFSLSRESYSPFFSAYYPLKFHFVYFPVAMILGGLFFTEYVFADLSTRRRREAYLRLPAANVEKVAAKWVLTALVFPVVFVLLYQLFGFFAKYFVGQTFGLRLVDLPLTDRWLWRQVPLYVGVQAVFFLGAVLFKRFAAVKTILALAGVFVVVSLLQSLFLSLLVPGLPFTGHFLGFDPGEPLRSASLPNGAGFQAAKEQAAKVLAVLGLLLPFLLLLVGFLKFKEMEIS